MMQAVTPSCFTDSCRWSWETLLRKDSVGMELFSCGVLLLALTLTGESHLRFKTHNLIYFAI